MGYTLELGDCWVKYPGRTYSEQNAGIASLVKNRAIVICLLRGEIFNSLK